MPKGPRIHLTGASCAGVTTLGAALAAELGQVHVDCDDHYWLPTDPPFTTKRELAERVASIRRSLDPAGWVLSGSLVGWGDALVAEGSLVVFVVTPTKIRLDRLALRERERYGARIDPGGDMHRIHQDFAAWAARYDDPAFTGRSRATHERWLGQLSVPVLRVNGTEPVAALVDRVIAAAMVGQGTRERG